MAGLFDTWNAWNLFQRSSSVVACRILDLWLMFLSPVTNFSAVESRILRLLMGSRFYFRFVIQASKNSEKTPNFFTTAVSIQNEQYSMFLIVRERDGLRILDFFWLNFENSNRYK